MMEPLRLYLRYVALSIRSQLQYRVSLAMWAFGNLLTTGLEFFSVWALFERFGQIRGWTLAEVALLYGMANVAFALSEIVARGFKSFSTMVRTGDFDRVLLRPRGTAFQVGAEQVDLVKLGRFLQGIAVLSWAIAALPVDWTPAHGALVLTAILGGACTFSGIFVLQGTLAFWTVEALEIAATVTYGGVETAQYPLSIYTTGFRRFFTYVVPLAFLNYIPALALLDRPHEGVPAWLPWLSPVVGIAFLLACLQVWRIGVRHYRSTGS
jgi:ABC-2 type transport system permease protein